MLELPPKPAPSLPESCCQRIIFRNQVGRNGGDLPYSVDECDRRCCHCRHSVGGDDLNFPLELRSTSTTNLSSVWCQDCPVVAEIVSELRRELE